MSDAIVEWAQITPDTLVVADRNYASHPHTNPTTASSALRRLARIATPGLCVRRMQGMIRTATFTAIE